MKVAASRNSTGLAVAACLCITLGFAAHSGLAATTDSQVMQLAVGDHRSEGHAARNRYRHPVETLSFFGLRKDMTVVEISPGGSGWYTEILAPFLREDGQLYCASYDSEATSDYVVRNTATFSKKLSARPDLYDRVKVTEFAPPGKTDIAPAGSADLIVTFRNVHGWLGDGAGPAAFAAFFKALKPGGVLGLVQHRGDPGTPQDPEANSGYVNEDVVIALARDAGFQLDASSEINANSADNRDHPEGVWTLLPGLRLKDQDRAKYEAIGESDRMTLRFVKPR